MLMLRSLAAQIILLIFLGNAAFAAEEDPEAIMYHPVHPDIVTNFVKSKSSRFGFLNIQVQLAFKNKFSELVELHQPIIEDGLVMHFSSLTQEEIVSVEGREKIRQDALKLLKDLMREETKDEVIEDLLFTKYMWQ